MWPARPGAPRACARAGAPARMEATSRGPAGEGAVAGGEGAVARVSRGHLARASFRGLMESRSCALCAARAERSEALARHLRPETGCSATKLLLSLFFLLSVELKLKAGWGSTGTNCWERLGRSISRERC